MALTKKELKNIKNKLKQNNPGVISSIRNRNQVITVNSNNEDENSKTKIKKQKSIVKWNFSVNDLVEVIYSRSQHNIHFKNIKMENTIPIGLIVSDYIYHTSKVEKNNFFVLVENRVIQLDGKYLRRV